MKHKLTERIRWWIHSPRFELIYLLGGIPKEHNGGVLHYRNINDVIANIGKQLARAEFFEENKE